MSEEILSTRPVKHILQLAELAWRKRQIVVYSGRTGIGKSEGMARLAASNGFPKIMIRCRATTRNSGILLSIADHFQIPRGKGREYLSLDKLYPVVGERLRESHAILAIDEADRLADSTLELLRDLMDEYQVGCLLVGNESLEPKIDAALERLARRIYRWREKDLKREELWAVLAAKGYKLSDAEATLVWEYCGGSPGWALAIVRLAQEIAERNNVKRDVEDIKMAMEIIPKPKRKRQEVGQK